MNVVFARRFGSMHLFPKDVHICFFETERKTWFSASKCIAPRCLIFNLSMLCRMPISRRCNGQAANGPAHLTEPGPHHRNARKFSPTYATGDMERRVGNTKKLQPRRKSPPNSNRMRKKEKTEKNADGPGPWKDTVPCRSLDSSQKILLIDTTWSSNHMMSLHS